MSDQPAQPVNENTLFVRNIPYSSDQNAINEYFSQFGKITAVRLLTDKFRGQVYSRGIAFVECDSAETLDKILAQESHVLQNRTLFVDKARPRVPRKRDTAFIGGIPAGTTVDALKAAFQQYNPVEAKIIRENNERSRGFGFVRFATPEDQTKAVTENRTIQLNGGESIVRFARRNFDAPPRRRRRTFRRRAPRGNNAPAQGQAPQ